MRAHLSNNHNGNFSQKILKLRNGKLPSSITNSPQLLLDNELAQIDYSLGILVDTIYPDIENLTERKFN